MEIRQLQYLCAVAARRSFRRAADDTFVSQPALSQQITKLERELNVTLIDRSARPVRLTEPGERFVRRALHILEEIDAATAEVQDASGQLRGRVQIGAMHYLVHLGLPELLAEFRTRHPLVEIYLRIGNSGEIMSMLAAREIQAGLLHVGERPPGPEYAVREIRTERLVVVTARTDDLDSVEHLSLHDVANMPLIMFREGAATRKALQDAFDSAGIVPRTAFESGDMATAIALVAGGHGVAVVPRSVALHEADRLRMITLDTELERTLALVTGVGRFQPAALQAFSEFVTDALAEVAPVG